MIRLFVFQIIRRCFPCFYKKLAFYDLSNFVGSRILNIDLRPYAHFFRNGGDARDYCIVMSRGLGYEYGLSKIYRDADFGFILCKKKRLWLKFLATIMFDVDPKSNDILVKQIQGVRKRHTDLKCVKWERMLLRLVIDWAASQSFNKIEVIQSKNSSWYLDRRKEAMYLHYDVTAKRLGMKFDNDSQKYVLVINQTNGLLA